MIPLITAAIWTISAASFLLLAPSAALGDYIACSSIYSVTSWAALWLLPAVTNYEAERVSAVRSAQATLVIVSSVVTLSLHPNIVGALFVALLWVEATLFIPSMLLFQSRTVVFQTVELARAVASATGVLVAAALFDGDPVAVCVALVAVMLGVGATLSLAGVHRPPRWRFPMVRPAELRRLTISAFESRPSKALLASRLLEIGSIVTLNRPGSIGSVVSLKLGLAIASALSTNARRHRLRTLLTAGTTLYVIGLGAVVVANTTGIVAIPGALRSVGWADPWRVLPVFLVCFALVAESLKADSRVSSEARRTSASEYRPRAPRVAVIGCVGVPARYGGFETLAEQLGRHVRPEEMAFRFYCEARAYPGVERDAFCGHRRVFVPLRANGLSSVAYDSLSILHALCVAPVDGMLVLGYSGAFALPLVRWLSPRCRVVTNIDGMEWRRQKWGPASRALLRLLERAAVRWSNVVVADNAVIASIAKQEYGVAAAVIPYGGDHCVVPESPCSDVDADFGEFHLSVARVEPENNCHLILEAFSGGPEQLVFVGNWDASCYGRSLRRKHASDRNIWLLDPIYDLNRLAALRSRAIGYVHGHSVGGTNPSLIEALFWSSNLFVFDCEFNRSTLQGQGQYFRSAEDLRRLLGSSETCGIPDANLEALKHAYRWHVVSHEYVRVLGGRHHAARPGVASEQAERAEPTLGQVG